MSTYAKFYCIHKPLVAKHPVDEALLRPGRPTLFTVVKLFGFPLFEATGGCLVNVAVRFVTGGLPMILPVTGGPLFVPGFGFFAGIVSCNIENIFFYPHNTNVEVIEK